MIFSLRMLTFTSPYSLLWAEGDLHPHPLLLPVLSISANGLVDSHGPTSRTQGHPYLTNLEVKHCTETP